MGQYSEADIAKIVSAVLSQVSGNSAAAPAGSGCPSCGDTVFVSPSSVCSAEPDFPVETSARHVHLTREAVDILFGSGYQLTKKKDLSQPGQFACNEKVKIVTAKGEIAGVSVLGPVRKEVQVELSKTDSRTLGIDAPLRISGDLHGAADVLLIGPCGILDARGSDIVAQAHIHMTPRDAARFSVSDGDFVAVRVESERPMIYGKVAIRVTDRSALAMHIDTDEANAGFVPANARGVIAGFGNMPCAVPTQKEEKRVVKYEKLENKSHFYGQNEKLLITEAVAKQMVCNGEKYVEIPKNAIVTPGARDLFIREKVTMSFQK